MSLEKIILAHYNKIKRLNNEYFKCIMDDNNIKIWYILVYGLDEPFKNGEYIFKIIIDDQFPDSPPSFRALTPNGVFIADGMPICVSIGEFHKKSYRSGLGMYGFILNAIINAMIFSKEGNYGIRYIVEKEETRKEYAKTSKKYNKDHYEHLLTRFHNN